MLILFEWRAITSIQHSPCDLHKSPTEILASIALSPKVISRVWSHPQVARLHTSSLQPLRNKYVQNPRRVTANLFLLGISSFTLFLLGMSSFTLFLLGMSSFTGRNKAPKLLPAVYFVRLYRTSYSSRTWNLHRPCGQLTSWATGFLPNSRQVKDACLTVGSTDNCISWVRIYY